MSEGSPHWARRRSYSGDRGTSTSRPTTHRASRGRFLDRAWCCWMAFGISSSRIRPSVAPEKCSTSSNKRVSERRDRRRRLPREGDGRREPRGPASRDRSPRRPEELVDDGVAGATLRPPAGERTRGSRTRAAPATGGRSGPSSERPPGAARRCRARTRARASSSSRCGRRSRARSRSGSRARRRTRTMFRPSPTGSTIGSS